MFKLRNILFLLVLFFWVFQLSAQEISADLKNANVPLNGSFAIAIKVTGAEVKNYSGFPEIQGLSLIHISEPTRPY